MKSKKKQVLVSDQLDRPPIFQEDVWWKETEEQHQPRRHPKSKTVYISTFGSAWLTLVQSGRFVEAKTDDPETTSLSRHLDPAKSSPNTQAPVQRRR